MIPTLSLSRVDLDASRLTPTRNIRPQPKARLSARDRQARTDHQWLLLRTEGEIGPDGVRHRLGAREIAERYNRTERAVRYGIRRAIAVREALDASRPLR